ncbi:hypothetical protein ACFQX6_18535 [Streptosporangium lutulentum]
MRELPRRIHRWSLARQMLVLQTVVVGVTVAGSALLAFSQAGDLLGDEASRRAEAVAVSVADSPRSWRASATPPSCSPTPNGSGWRPGSTSSRS